MNMRQLPLQDDRAYSPVGSCIYCGRKTELSTEHIIPYGLGGRWIIPESSCLPCAKKTGAFEGTCQRSILGPLRMHYNLPTRRPQERPSTLPLKVKLKPDGAWTTIQVDRDICPFLVLFPILDLPEEITDSRTRVSKGATARTFWIRAASFSDGISPGDPMTYLGELCKKLGISSVEPTAAFRVPEFFRMLAKIAHAFSVAELGGASFRSFLVPSILENKLDDSARYIGGMTANSHPSTLLHQVSQLHCTEKPELVIVGIQLFAPLGTPTYVVVVGSRT